MYVVGFFLDKVGLNMFSGKKVYRLCGGVCRLSCMLPRSVDTPDEYLW